MESLLVLLGFLGGAILAGGVVWWWVYKGPTTQTAAEKKVGTPIEISTEEAAREFYQKGKNAKDVDEQNRFFHQSH